jgi:DNA-binding response OmpR family regulator
MRLTIVDDHANTREMNRDFLSLSGIMFCECATGEEALVQVCEFKSNWITMDGNIPSLNGFQCAEAPRAEHPSVHIILLSPATTNRISDSFPIPPVRLG